MIPHARGHRARVGGTILFDGMSQPGGSSAVAARPDPADRSRSGPRDDVRPAQALKAAPCGTTPWVAYRQRAIKSFRTRGKRPGKADLTRLRRAGVDPTYPRHVGFGEDHPLGPAARRA